MTRGAIRDFVRRRLGESTEAFWLDTELNTWINDACHDIAYRAKCLKTNGFLSTTEDVQEYELASNFTNILSITEVYYKQDNDRWAKLKMTTREELDRDYQGWKSMDAGTPNEYYYDIEEDVLGFHVKPDDVNDGSEVAQVYYTLDHVDMTLDADTPTIPQILHTAIIDWVTATGHDTRGSGDKANDAWSKYYAMIQLYITERRREREDEDIVMVNYRNVR